MDKSFINIDLGDPRTSLVAEALSNKTCVKILNILTEAELTASDISQKLNLPLNTIGYNLDKLIAAGLVEKSNKFFWSVKGKKTPVYKLANKKIIISPKKLMKGIIPIIILSSALVIMALLMLFGNPIQSANYGNGNLDKFESYDQFVNYIEEANSNNQVDSFGGTTVAEARSSDTSGSPALKSSSYATDYSQTNIQVEGVDELDTVKNDGHYIYTVSQNKVIIVEAYPADGMNVVSELEFDNYLNGIFVKNGKLIVVESSYGAYGFAESKSALDVDAKIAIVPPNYGKSEVKVHVYRITDDIKSDPEKLQTFAVDGNYQSARLINGYVYIIANKYIESSNPEIPYFKAGETVENKVATDIYYPGPGSSNLLFTLVMGINLENLEYKGELFLTGTGSTLYVSKDAIYFTNIQSYDYSKVQEGTLKVIVDSLPSNIKSEGEKIIDSKADYYVKSDQINSLLQKNFNQLTDSEKKEIENNIAKGYKDYYQSVSKEYELTSIHKISLDGLNIKYSGNGKVPGYILNQFSIDSYNGYLRIATTTGNSFGNPDSSFNNLYILNDDFEIVGSVEGLAEGESIYSARFVGDKAYMVTFRQVDPLYVIDLSDPNDPNVLGYLKVTGFSNYLHPIGDNLLLGIGREATEEGRSQGLKISLFDVTDFSNPVEVDKYVVEGDWSYSEAEYEHKAVLFDDSRDLLVIPVTYYEEMSQKVGKYWQGAFVFNVTNKDISLRGKIDHETKDQKAEDGYGYGQNYVQRSLFMDSVLYTISNKMIKANDLKGLTFISSVDLPYEEPDYVLY